MLRVANYRGLRDVTIPLSSFVCITGENNSGKSTVLQALSLFLSGSALKATDYFDPEVEISIEVTFADVTDADLALLVDEHRERIAELVEGGKLSLVRQYGADGKSQLGHFGLAPKDARFSPERISSLLKGKSRGAIKTAVLEAFPELQDDAASMTTQDAARQIILKHGQALPESEKETRFIPLPTGLDKSVIPMLPERIYIPAVKDLADETKTAETSSFGKILAMVMKAIEPLLAEEEGLFDKLSRKLTRTVTADGEVEDHRLGQVKDIEESIQRYVRESFANVTLEIEIPPPELKTLLSTARILADDGVRGPLELKGDGLRRAVVFSVLRTYVDLARGSGPTGEGEPRSERGYLLLFEEPELFLHPDAQKILFDALGVFATKNHVVVTTHSPLFLGPQTTATFVRLSKHSLPEVKPFTKASPVDLNNLARKDEFQIICYENNSAALFAKRVVLVEGDSDYIAFPHIAETINSAWDCRLRSVAFVRVGGKGSIARYRSFFRRFDVPVFVITDLDALIDGFDKLEPSEAALRLRSDLLQKIDATTAKGDAVPSPNTEAIKREQARREPRDLWADVRAARVEYDRDRSRFGELDAAVEAFFAWEKRPIRVECLREGTAPGISEAKAALIAELRSQGVFVLARGALEDYYPEGIAGPDKLAKASAFRESVRTKEQMLGLSSRVKCPRTAAAVTEHQCMCSAIFGECQLPCQPMNPPANA